MTPLVDRCRATGTRCCVAAATLIALGLAGCSPLQETEGDARQTVEEFFALLETGSASQVAPLLSDDSPLLAGNLDMLGDEFYATVSGRPLNAVVESVAEEGGRTLVRANYELSEGAETRDITFVLSETDGDLLIDGWSGEGLLLSSVLPGAAEINGLVRTEALATSPEIVALPGVYEVQYVDPEGLGTTDPGGGQSEPIAVEFPVNDQEALRSPSSRIEIEAEGVRFVPRLTEQASKQLLGELRSSSQACASEMLMGSSCPPELVAKAESTAGDIDPESVQWTTLMPQRIVDGETWTFEIGLNVSWVQGDALQEIEVHPVGEIVADGDGGIAEIRWSE